MAVWIWASLRIPKWNSALAALPPAVPYAVAPHASLFERVDLLQDKEVLNVCASTRSRPTAHSASPRSKCESEPPGLGGDYSKVIDCHLAVWVAMYIK